MYRHWIRSTAPTIRRRRPTVRPRTLDGSARKPAPSRTCIAPYCEVDSELQGSVMVRDASVVFVFAPTMEVAIHAASRRPGSWFETVAVAAVCTDCDPSEGPQASSATCLRVGSGAGTLRVDLWPSCRKKKRQAEPAPGASKRAVKMHGGR